MYISSPSGTAHIRVISPIRIWSPTVTASRLPVAVGRRGAGSGRNVAVHPYVLVVLPRDPVLRRRTSPAPAVNPEIHPPRRSWSSPDDFPFPLRACRPLPEPCLSPAADHIRSGRVAVVIYAVIARLHSARVHSGIGVITVRSQYCFPGKG